MTSSLYITSKAGHVHGGPNPCLNARQAGRFVPVRLVQIMVYALQPCQACFLPEKWHDTMRELRRAS